MARGTKPSTKAGKAKVPTKRRSTGQAKPKPKSPVGPTKATTEPTPNKCRNFFVPEEMLELLSRLTANPGSMIEDKKKVTAHKFIFGDLLGARCEGCVEHRVRCEYPDVKKLERDEESGLWVVRFGTCRCCKSARRSCRPPLRRAPPTAAALQKRRSRKRMSEKLAAAAAGIPYVEKKEDEEMAAQPINEEPDYDGDTTPFSVPLPRCNKHKLCHAANYHDLNGQLPLYFDDDVWDVLSITSPVASPVSSRAPSPEPQSSVLLTQTEAADVLLSMHLWTSPTASSSTEAAPSMPSSPVESAYSLPPSPVLPHLSVAKSPSLSSYHRRSSSECSSVGPMTPTLTSCVSLPPISALPKAPWLYRKEQAPVRSTYSPPSEERLPMLSIPSDATLYPDSLQAGAITRA